MRRDPMEYQCTLIRGKRKERWQGEIRLIHCSDTCYEAEITGRGTYFHVIAGKHRYGNYICIPNHDAPGFNSSFIRVKNVSIFCKEPIIPEPFININIVS